MYSEDKIQQVWNKARIIEGYDPNKIRQDFAGAWIKFDDYGKQNEWGWSIDHIIPVSRTAEFQKYLPEGENHIYNLQALQWQNNENKADNLPTFTTVVSSDKNYYKEVEQQAEVRVNTQTGELFCVILS